MTTTTNSTAPLRGIRVLDLTRLLPGPACTLHLADLGAEVIKIEDTEQGDYASKEVRELVNRNKRALRLNLKIPSGRQILLELVKDADILVESFRAGVMDRLGVGYAALHLINPALVFCSITGFGQHGPLASEPGHDINFCALSGVSDQAGHPQTGPALSNVPFGDLLGGTMTAVSGILAALFDAHRSGKGRHVDISIADSMLAQTMLPLALYNRDQQVPRVGTTALTGALPCYGVYKTKDNRYIGMGAFEKKFWDRFCDLVERADLKPYHTPSDPATAAKIKQEVSNLFAQHNLHWWQQMLEGSGTCVTPILQVDEAMAHPHFIARGMSLGQEKNQQLGCPIQMTDFHFVIQHPAPQPGAHTHSILKELGYNQETIDTLLQQGAIA